MKVARKKTPFKPFKILTSCQQIKNNRHGVISGLQNSKNSVAISLSQSLKHALKICKKKNKDL